MFNDAYLSRERTIFVCYQFFKQLRNRYGRKPIFTDGAHWYNDACRWLRLDHRVYGTELKNIMERFIRLSRDFYFFIFNTSRTELNVSMIISHAERRIVIGSMFGTG
jgi:transposase-like protein